MELNDIYIIANAINEKIMQGELHKNELTNIEIKVKVTPTILYGIDKEFYRLTNNDSTDGFESSDEVRAQIDDINFVFVK